MGRLVDIDALTIGDLEALANERGLRLITKETYEDFRSGRFSPDPAEGPAVIDVERSEFGRIFGEVMREHPTADARLVNDILHTAARLSLNEGSGARQKGAGEPR